MLKLIMMKIFAVLLKWFLELGMDEYPHQSVSLECNHSFTKIILSMGSANGRLQYNVTSTLIGWAHTKYDPCFVLILKNS